MDRAFHRLVPGLDVDGDGHSPVEELRGRCLIVFEIVLVFVLVVLVVLVLVLILMVVLVFVFLTVIALSVLHLCSMVDK